MSGRTRPLAHTFSDSAASLAQEKISAGHNPFAVWTKIRGIDVAALGHAIDLGGRYTVEGREKNGHASSEALMQGILRGVEPPSGDLVYDLCCALGISPDALLPRRAAPDSEAFVLVPCPSPVFEAAVIYAQARPRTHSSAGLHALFESERAIAERLGEESAFPGFPSNRDLLATAEMHYMHALIERSSLAVSTTQEEERSPVTVILDTMDEAIQLEARYRDHFASKQMAELETIKNNNNLDGKALWACVHALAPNEQGDAWLQEFLKHARQHGIESSFQTLKRQPDAFHPLRPFWQSSASVRIDGYGFLVGRRIIDVFCEVSRRFSKGWHELSSREIAMEETLDDLDDFKVWLRAPQTRDFLKAEAHVRLLENTPGLHAPVPAGASPSHATNSPRRPAIR